MDKKIEIKKYNMQYKIDRCGNYYPNKKIQRNGEKNMTEYVHNNYNKLLDEEIKNVAIKCITTTDAKRILLNYDFFNYDFSQHKQKSMSLKQVKTYVEKFFHKYQSKAGGFYIEDTVWGYYDNDKNPHDIPEYKIMFDNTIDKMDFIEIETSSYIDRLDEIFNCLAENIKCTILVLKLEGEGLMCIQIWFKDLNMNNEDSDSEEDC